jgi:hypothetical protein
VKQDYANSTVVFDWNKVDNIQTNQPFVVVNDKGDAFSGHLSETADEHIVKVAGASQVSIPHDEVVSIQETGETFVRRLRGDIDLGLSFAQSNAQKNLTLQGDLTYQATTQLAELSSSSQFTSQKEVSEHPIPNQPQTNADLTPLSPPNFQHSASIRRPSTPLYGFIRV